MSTPGAAPCPDPQIISVRRRDLLPYLRADPVGHVQSLYMCLAAPDAEAEALPGGPGGTLSGFLLGGGPPLAGINPLAARLHVTSLAAAGPLALHWWRSGAGTDRARYLALPVWVEGAVRAALPEDAAAWSTDSRACCTPHDFRPPAVDHEVLWVDRSNAGALRLPPGWEADLPAPGGEDLCASVRSGGVIVARACSYVQTMEIGYVQRVETLPAYRRRGFAATAVAAVTRALFHRHKAAVAYHYDETNVASASTCRALGFRVHGRVAIVTRRPAEGVPGGSGERG